jgi:hypothetical protein
MVKKLLFTLFLVLVQAVVFSQTVGDYQTAGSGPWTTLGSWLRWNGSSWLAPTTGQGYAGQFAGTGAVEIKSGHTISIGNMGISTQSMGTLTISGSLELTGVGTGGTGTDFNFTTQTIIVTPLLGIITFINKTNLILPSNASLQVISSTNPSYSGLNGDCNHNQDIYIGSSVYAYCNGGGSTGLTFVQVMAGGGTLNAIATSNSPVCQGSQINLFGSYTGVQGATVTYSWSIKDPNNTITTTSTQNPIISNSILGTYTITFTCNTTYNSNAYSNNETISVTVNALPTAPVVGTVTQPTCALGTGSVVLNGLPASGTWTLTRSGTSIATTTGTGTTTTISGLSVGTYYYTISNGTCTSIASSGVTINNQAVNTWNGSVWSTGLAPTSSDKIVFAGNYNTSALPVSIDIVACSCQVTSGTVTIASGNTMTLTNELTVSGGTLTFENNASLVQINDNAINIGNITYKRSNATTRETDYTYWSSPVAGQTLKNLSPKTPSNFFYSFNATADDWSQENSANVMSIGNGYIIRGPHYTSTPPPGFYEAPFQGIPNNGNISVSIPFPGKESSNLIGNPYPSALNADLFLTTNSLVLDGTLYFWTHNTAIDLAGNISNPGSGVYAYSSDDYATYNLTGGVGIGNFVGSIEQTSNKPTGKIASGQAFFATGIAAGSAVFNNNMRVSGGASGVNNSQFFKMANSKTTSLIEKHRIWLNLTNSEGAFKQTLLGYVTNATNGYDNSFDGESFDGNQFVDFYSVNEDKNLTIQGRALPFDENDVVSLGFSSTIEGAFSIGIDEVDGLFTSQDVFIEDKNTNSIKNLKEGPYTFTTESGTFNDRFVLRYTNTNKTLDTDSFETLEKTILVSNKNKLIKINSSVEMINKVQVYDLLGRSVYQKLNVDLNELTISNLVINNQVLLVKILLKNGKTVTKKIIY